MNTRKLLFYMLAGLLGGCVPVMSLHPFYTKENVVFDKKLLGTWVDDPNRPETTWHFESIDEPRNAYKLIFIGEDGQKGSFVAHLLKLKDRLFLISTRIRRPGIWKIRMSRPGPTTLCS